MIKCPCHARAPCPNFFPSSPLSTQFFLNFVWSLRRIGGIIFLSLFPLLCSFNIFFACIRPQCLLRKSTKNTPFAFLHPSFQASSKLSMHDPISKGKPNIGRAVLEPASGEEGLEFQHHLRFQDDLVVLWLDGDGDLRKGFDEIFR